MQIASLTPYTNLYQALLDTNTDLSRYYYSNAPGKRKPLTNQQRKKKKIKNKMAKNSRKTNKK